MRPTPALRGIRIISLALNLPGPAALMRLSQMGARCTKVNPPAGDPMQAYTPEGYAQLHQGVQEITLDLKSAAGQRRLDQRLAKTDVLLTSFRPSALRKLGLDWASLQARHPQLCLVEVVGAPGLLAEVPGHDLTYQAEVGLVPGLDLPPSLYADMGGAIMASEATLEVLLQRQRSGKGLRREVALSQAAAWLSLPRQWRMTTPEGAVGGAHAGYRLYPCRNGRVAVAALEPHFAQRLCEAAGLALQDPMREMFRPATHTALAAFFAGLTRARIDRLAQQHDLPLMTLAGGH
jgi:crotonobetainyl-CoA:carnitine CoA-transferase CaiB-like acyl-CoA transferase